MEKRANSKIPTVIFSCMAAVIFSCMAAVILCCNISLADETGIPNRRVDNHQILMNHLLDLSSEQMETMKTIRDGYSKQMAQERNNVHKAREKFKRTAEATDDVAVIRLAYAPVAAAMEDMAITKMLMKKDIDKILTVEQKKKAKELNAELFKNKPKHRPFPGPEGE